MIKSGEREVLIGVNSTDILEEVCYNIETAPQRCLLCVQHNTQGDADVTVFTVGCHSVTPTLHKGNLPW